MSLEDFLESCRAPALLTELEDDDEADDALDSDKENESTYQEAVSIAMVFCFCISTRPVMGLWCFDSPCRLVVERIRVLNGTRSIYLAHLQICLRRFGAICKRDGSIPGNLPCSTEPVLVISFHRLFYFFTFNLCACCIFRSFPFHYFHIVLFAFLQDF